MKSPDLTEHLAEIPDWVRLEVLDRDGWQCQKCGDNHLERLTLHHVMYRSHGGTHHSSNLITLCWWCHRLIHDGFMEVKMVRGIWYFSRQHAG